jgi:hypothetical protein
MSRVASCLDRMLDKVIRRSFLKIIAGSVAAVFSGGFSRRARAGTRVLNRRREVANVTCSKYDADGGLLLNQHQEAAVVTHSEYDADGRLQRIYDEVPAVPGPESGQD